MLHIGDKVNISGSGNRTYTIVHISDKNGTLKYRGFDYDYTVLSDLLGESDMMVVERATEPNTITAGEDVLVSKYSDTRVIQESSDAYRTSEWTVEPEPPIHGVVTSVNGFGYQLYYVTLDNGKNVKVKPHDIMRAADYTLF